MSKTATRRCLACLFERRAHPIHKPLVLVVVEGPFDIEFLKRISTMLADGIEGLADLADMERRRELVFFPVGGAPWPWIDRLAAFGLPEFHLYDREAPPATEWRARAADAVNLRSRCQAVLTTKRSLENYLHPHAIAQACGIDVQFGDHEQVADLIAERMHDEQSPKPWGQLPRRTQARRRNRVKRWLHTKAVDCMTVDRLAQRDPQGEVISWIKSIARLASYESA